jgi:hypothetical protein
MTWTGNVSPVLWPKNGHGRHERKVSRFMARRVVNDGFPIPARPMTRQEIDDYLGGDVIVCLLCGRRYQSVGAHLTRVHGMSSREYQDRYGLPYSRGLVSARSRAIKSAIGKKMAEENGGRAFSVEAHALAIARSKEFFKHNEMPRQPYADQELRDRALPPNLLDEFLNRVKAGRFPSSVMDDPDLPGKTWIACQLRARPDKRAALKNILDEMPFHWQAAAGVSIGPRIIPEIKRLRAEGKSDYKIAAELGLTSMAIWYKRKKHGIK